MGLTHNKMFTKARAHMISTMHRLFWHNYLQITLPSIESSAEMNLGGTLFYLQLRINHIFSLENEDLMAYISSHFYQTTPLPPRILMKIKTKYEPPFFQECV